MRGHDGRPPSKEEVMDNQGQAEATSTEATPVPAGYEAPRVERILAASELEAEVLYAGAPASPR